jgi:hypothetical protein
MSDRFNPDVHPDVRKAFQSIGLVLSEWTFLEDVLNLHITMATTQPVAEFLIHALNNSQKIRFIRANMVPYAQHNKAGGEATEFFLTCANVCAGNRAFFAHSIARRHGDNGQIRLDKHSKSKPGKTDIRIADFEVIDEIIGEFQAISQFGARAALNLYHGSPELLPRPAQPRTWDARLDVAVFATAPQSA